ncbi:MAG: EAL domain-containing protein [Maricaulaceae bacterium]|nr:EAL domain-containing protein [Maricaulaceae bacterium]
MTAPDFQAAAEAAGVLAFVIRDGRITFAGDPARFGLAQAGYALDAFMERLAPGDRAGFEKALRDAVVDLRLRLVTEAGEVRYARLLGRRGTDGGLSGIMAPAGLAGAGARDRISRETGISEAVEAGEIIPHYQPIVTLENGRLAGFEALARWRRPGAASLAPGEFLDLATELDLLGEIGDRVRAAAAKDLSAWRAANPDAPLFVSANASVGELLSKGFAPRLLDAIAAAGLRAGAYKLEIAETEIMRDPDRAEKVLLALREGGVSLALDDFGAGYSSLARLDRFPFDTVKIDQYFVRGLAANGGAAKVVESVISLASHYGMTVVAEGVEDEATAQRLRAMGCDFAQGFRYAGALTPGVAALAVKEGAPKRFLPPG